MTTLVVVATMTISMKQTKPTYEGFDYPATELAKYLESAGIFSISLKDGKIIHFSPTDVEGFRNWLTINKVENIKRPMY